MQITIDKKSSAKALNLINNAPELFDKALKIGLMKAGTELQDDAVNDAPYLSGHLRRSIVLSSPLADRGLSIQVGTNLIYARIHDQGGIIKPKTKKFLAFKINGKWIRTKKVTIKKYKGKGYLTPAYDKQVKGKAKKTILNEIEKITN